MPPPFRPVVQDGDRARLVRAHAELFASKGAIYQLHFQLLKVASIKNSAALKASASAWMGHSDMLVSTSFDIEHFEAQLRDRVARGLTQFIAGLTQTLNEVKGRHDVALDALDDAENQMEEDYVRLVPPGNQGRTRDQLRKVFNENIRGPKRPKKLPKKKDTGFPGIMAVLFQSDADFGGPQLGRKMRLTVRKN